MAITIVTPAVTTDLTTLSTVLFELGLTSDNGARDAYINRAIKSASEAITQYLNRPLAQQRIKETMRSKGLNTLIVRRAPVTTLHQIMFNGEVVDPSHYRLEDAGTGIIRRRGGYLWAHTGYDDAYEVEYTYGYTLPPAANFTLPATLEQACVFAVSSIWQAKGRDITVRREKLDDVYEVEYGNPSSAQSNISSGLPARVIAMIEPYRFVNV